MDGQSTNISHLSHIQKTYSTLSLLLEQHLSLLLPFKGFFVNRYIFQSPPQKQRTDHPLRYLLYLPANQHQRPACQWRTEMTTSSWGTGDRQTLFQTTEQIKPLACFCVASALTMLLYECRNNTAWPYRSVRWLPPDASCKWKSHSIRRKHNHARVDAFLISHNKMQSVKTNACVRTKKKAKIWGE